MSDEKAQLFSSEELALCDDAEQQTIARGHYTADRLPEAKKARVVELLSKGVFSKRDIAKFCEVSFETVMAVEMEHRAGSIRAGKDRMVKTLEIILAYSEEALMQRAKTEGLSALEHAILLDKKELLTGGVTSRHEVVTGGSASDEDDDYTRAVKEARQGMVIDAEEVLPKALPLTSDLPDAPDPTPKDN